MPLAVSPTAQDLLNAAKYAAHLFTVNAAREYFRTKNVKLVEKTIPWDEHITRGLSSVTELEPCVVLEFDKEACEAIDCFEFKKYTRCETWDKERLIDDGVNKYRACQDSCNHFKVKYNTFWDGSNCKLVNKGLKEFCVVPALRAYTYGYFNKQPPFTWNQEKSECYNNDAYCTHFGMRLQDDGECDYNLGPKIFHWIFGENLTRLYTNEVLYPPHKYRHGWEDVEVDAPQMIEEAMRGEEARALLEDATVRNASQVPRGGYEFAKSVKGARWLHAAPTPDEKKDDKEDPLDYYSGQKVSIRVIKRIGELVLSTIAIEFAIKLSAITLSYISSYVSTIVFSEVLPASIYAFAAGIGTAVEALATSGVVLAIGGVLEALLSGLLSLANPVFLFLAGSQLGGFIADQLLEQYSFVQTDLKNLVTAKMLKKACAFGNDIYAYATMGRQKFDGTFYTLDPLYVWAQNVASKEHDSERLKYVILKSAHYLKLLKYNSLGQVIKWEEAPDDRVRKLNVTVEGYHDDIPQNVRNLLFEAPSKGRLYLWGGLGVLFVVCGYVFCAFHVALYLILMLLVFCLISTDMLVWWSRNDTITGNILYVYDAFATTDGGQTAPTTSATRI